MGVRKALLGVTTLLIAIFAGIGSAAAESPPGCIGDSLSVQFVSGTATIHRNGQTVNLVAAFRNPAANSCDDTDFSVTMTLPGPDGTPGQTVLVAEHLNAPSGTLQTNLPAVPFTINYNDGVFKAPVTLTISSYTWHGPGGDVIFPGGGATSQLAINRPHVSLSVTASPTSGPGPLPVTYTYHAINDSTYGTGDVAANVNSAAITDDRCSPVTYVSGDTIFTSPLQLNHTEDWTFTCSTTIRQVGSIVNHATFTGNSSRDGLPWPTTDAQSTVVNHAADLVVGISHSGNFTRGSPGTYSVVARNTGDVATTQPASVAVAVPDGLTATAISGNGWACTLSTMTCSRTDSLGPGTSYEAISVTADVGAGAPDLVTASVAVTGDESDPDNNTGSDETAVGDPATPFIPVTPDTLAPRLTALRLAPTKFRAAKKGATVSARKKRKARVGTRISWKLSEPGMIRFGIERRVKHRRWTRLRGNFSSPGATGAGTVKFSGRLKGRKLKPGVYRLRVSATDPAGNRSATLKKSFRIVAG